ncbi:MAG: hypothetical protein ACYTG1_02635 [Planctomycetota bacterium]|jgi:hypothetical protein
MVSGIRRLWIPCAASVLAAGLGPAATGVETTVQNDSVMDGGTVAVQAGFIAGEEGAAWLQMPCTGTIVAVQVGWFDNSGQTSGATSIEDFIHIYDGGDGSSHPFPGGVLQDLEAPLMTEGFLNEFRFIDENNTIPLSVPVVQDQWIVVSFEFFNSPPPFAGPSLVTDINGCQFGRNAINCLPGGICIGWTEPCLLGISGDFMIRAVVDCGAVTGACCLTDGSCTQGVSPAQCAVLGGTYQGDFTDCGGVTCPVPTGACCVDTTCFPDLTENDCSVGGGAWAGAGTVCPDACLPPQGACCFGTSDCSVLEPANCSLAGGVYQGDGTDCADANMNGDPDVCEPPQGACCFSDASCSNLIEANCTLAGGTWQGAGTDCATFNCPLPQGACCLAGGGCFVETQGDCEAIPGATWAGAGTDCVTGCLPPCPADCADGGDGSVDVTELLRVLAQWSTGGSPGVECDVLTTADNANARLESGSDFDHTGVRELPTAAWEEEAVMPSGRTRGRSACVAGLLAACLAPAADAVEVTVLNDSLNSGSSGFVQAGFDPGEWAAAWLTAPPSGGTIVAVQVGWYSVVGGQLDQIEQNIRIWDGGTFPTPGTPLATLASPLLTDGVINEYRYLDVLQTIPINIPVSPNQEFVVGFQFANDPQPFPPVGGPSVVTDADGCQQGRNSVFCLSGCVGWNDPCLLGFSGDFLIRAVIETGGPPTGACCFTDGSCTDALSVTDCVAQGGTYQGDLSTCATVTCPLPVGACCLDPGCAPDQTQPDCELGGGTWAGPNTSCPDDCLPPQGACCFGETSCSVLTSADCGVAGGAYQGDGTDCADGNMNGDPDICEPPQGACCFADASCANLTAADCGLAGGTWQGAGTDCATFSCPLPEGACCLANGNCITEIQTDCEAIPGAVWTGPGTDCTDANTNGTADACEPPCPADCADGGDGSVDVTELLRVLAQWSTGGSPGVECDVATCSTCWPTGARADRARKPGQLPIP